LPGTIGSSAIQTIIASNFCSTRHVARPHEHVAAADVDFVGERQRNRLRREGFGQVAIERDDPLDAARFATGEGHQLVPLADDARRDRAAEAAEVEVGSQDRLHGKAEVLQVAVGADIDVSRGHHRADVPGILGSGRRCRR
jgi:hypothetical protein